ncbi:MAG: TMEM165/GDT1 family protein [Firmicutes bacterium]|nr:TMEM165/GDT1 family protein [Bacillota bacterium]
MKMWKTFFITFVLVFLAELGDKTQLTTMLMAAHNSESMLGVFLGASAALILTSLIGVLLGGTIAEIIPTSYIHAGAGSAFIIIGILLITGRF